MARKPALPFLVDDSGRELCGGRRRDGEPCRNPRGWRTDHPGHGRCMYHGGCTNAGKVAAQRQQLVSRVGDLRERFRLPADQVDPATVLLEALVLAREDALAWHEAISELTSGEGGTWFAEDANARLVHPAVVEARHARRELAQIAKWGVDAGIEERRIRLAEQYGVEMAGVIDRILTRTRDALLAAGLSAEDVHRVFDTTAVEVVRGELLAVEGGSE